PCKIQPTFNKCIPWIQLPRLERPGHAQSVRGSKIRRTKAVVLPPMPRKLHASTQYPRAYPYKWTIRGSNIRAIDVVDESIRGALPGITGSRGGRTPPPEALGPSSALRNESSR